MTASEMQNKLAKWHSESFGWALRCSAGDHSMAEDALQTVYLKILEGRAVFKGKSSFRSWLFSVIRFTVIDAQRKQKSHRKQMEVLQTELEQQSNTATAEMPEAVNPADQAIVSNDLDVDLNDLANYENPNFPDCYTN